MTKLRLTPTASQPVRPSLPPAGAPVIIATDVARTTWKHAVHWDERVQRSLATPGTLEHLQALVRLYHPAHPVLVVYEACGFGYEIAWWAQAAGIRVLVVAPSQVERAPGPRVKTDRLDARMLALKAAAGQLKGVAIPTRIQHEHRQVLRTYGQAVRARKRAQIQLRSVLQEHGRIGPLPGSGWRVYEQWLTGQVLPAPVAAAVAELRTLRAAAQASAGRLAQQLHALALLPTYAPLVAALTTHAGVGELSAMRVLLEGRHRPLWQRGLLDTLPGPDAERIQLGRHAAAPRSDSQVRAGGTARRAGAVCLGQPAQRSDDARGLRPRQRSGRPQARHHCRHAPLGHARPSPLARGARHPTRGRGITGGRSTPPCPCWSGNVPHECLRRRPGSPPTGGTSQSFAALGPWDASTNTDRVTVARRRARIAGSPTPGALPPHSGASDVTRHLTRTAIAGRRYGRHPRYGRHMVWCGSCLPTGSWSRSTTRRSGASAPRRASCAPRSGGSAAARAGVCHYCGKQVGAKALTMDHLVPIVRGGRSTKGNVVPACKDCNDAKKHRLAFELET